MTVLEETVFFVYSPACPILRCYRTTSGSPTCCLSDSPTISDNLQPFRMLLVRFSPDIGQPATLPHAACPILSRYRTTFGFIRRSKQKKAEPAMDSAFRFVLSVLFIFIRRIRLLRHRLKHGSFVLKLNGTRSILR